MIKREMKARERRDRMMAESGCILDVQRLKIPTLTTGSAKISAAP